MTERPDTTEREQGSSPGQGPSYSSELKRAELSETVSPNVDPLTIYE